MRTDFAYRYKHHPVLHFGLGKTTQIDIEIKTWDQRIFNYDNLAADTLHRIDLTQATAAADNFSNVKLQRFELVQNHPNPFNPCTTIRFSLPH